MLKENLNFCYIVNEPPVKQKTKQKNSGNGTSGSQAKTREEKMKEEERDLKISWITKYDTQLSQHKVSPTPYADIHLYPNKSCPALRCLTKNSMATRFLRREILQVSTLTLDSRSGKCYHSLVDSKQQNQSASPIYIL